MNSLAFSIKNHLERNMWPFLHYSSSDLEVFKVGILGQNQTMILNIFVPIHDDTQYVMQCEYVEYSAKPCGNHLSSLIPANVTVIKDGGLSFELKREHIEAYDDNVFIADSETLINTCDGYIEASTKDISMTDVWLSFITDLTNITFSASANMPNAVKINSDLIEEITQQLDLTDILYLYRSSDNAPICYPCYPQDKECQIKYIKGLLSAIFHLEVIAYENNFNLHSNNIVFMAMRGMGISQYEREEIIVTEFENFQNHFSSKRYTDILQSYLCMSNDDNRAVFLFENEGIICD